MHHCFIKVFINIFNILHIMLFLSIIIAVNSICVLDITCISRIIYNFCLSERFLLKNIVFQLYNLNIFTYWESKLFFIFLGGGGGWLLSRCFRFVQFEFNRVYLIIQQSFSIRSYLVINTSTAKKGKRKKEKNYF